MDEWWKARIFYYFEFVWWKGKGKWKDLKDQRVRTKYRQTRPFAAYSCSIWYINFWRISEQSTFDDDSSKIYNLIIFLILLNLQGSKGSCFLTLLGLLEHSRSNNLGNKMCQNAYFCLLYRSRVNISNFEGVDFQVTKSKYF